MSNIVKYKEINPPSYTVVQINYKHRDSNFYHNFSDVHLGLTWKDNMAFVTWEDDDFRDHELYVPDGYYVVVGLYNDSGEPFTVLSPQELNKRFIQVQ